MSDGPLSYDLWAKQYDTNQNKIRDMEGLSLRKILQELDFCNCPGISCGSGKNTNIFFRATPQLTCFTI